MGADVFKASQFLPSKNNVRPSWWISQLQSSSASHSSKDVNKDVSELLPTPHYNLAVLEDVAILETHSFISKLLSLYPSASQVILLFKVNESHFEGIYKSFKVHVFFIRFGVRR